MSWGMQLSLYISLAIVVVMVGVTLILPKFYKQTPQGRAFVRTGVDGTRISFGGILCVPILHRLDLLDITAKKIELRHFGENALRTKDNVNMDAQVGIILRIPPTEEGVLTVVQAHGCEKASDPSRLEEVFRDRFEEALTTSLRQFTWHEIEDSFEPLKSEFRRRAGTDLLGFMMEDVSFGHLAKPADPASTPNFTDVIKASKN